MKIKELSFTNLFRFADTKLVIDSDLNFIEGINFDDGGGSGGSNGSGKSSLFQNICWAIYGDTSRGIKADDILRWGTKSCEASVTFDNLKISRRRGTNAGLDIKIDGSIVEGRTASILNNKIRNYVGIDKGVFLNSIFWGQDWDTVLVEGTDKSRKDLLGTLIGFVTLDDILKSVRISLSGIERQKIKSEAGLEVYESRIKGVDRNSLISQEQQLSEKLSKLDGEYDDLNSLLVKVKEQHRLELQYKEYLNLKSKSEDINKQHEKVVEERRYLVERIKAYEDSNKIEILEEEHNNTLSEVNGKKRDIKKLEEALCINECPTCLQKVDSSHKEKLNSEIGALSQGISSGEQFLKEERSVLDKLKNELSSHKKRLENIKSDEVLLKTKLDRYDELRDVFKDFQQEDYGRSEDALQSEIKNIRDEINNSHAKTATIKQTIINYDEAIKNAEDTKRTLSKITKKVSTYKDLEQIFGQKGLRTYMLDTLVKDLEYKTNLYLRDLTDRNISVMMSSGDDLKISIVEDDRTCDWNSFSGGEKKRIAIAVRLSLWTYLLEQQCNLRFGLFDEVLGGLDVSGREKAISLLETLSRKYDVQIFLISHLPIRDIAANWNRILVERKDGIAEIKKEAN